jgi:hypothetical protein
MDKLEKEWFNLVSPYWRLADSKAEYRRSSVYHSLLRIFLSRIRSAQYAMMEKERTRTLSSSVMGAIWLFIKVSRMRASGDKGSCSC